MRKVIILAVAIIAIPTICQAEILGRIHEPFKSPAIQIDNNQLYVSDRGLSQIHIYSLPDLKKIRSFGRKGQGPGEFPSYFEFQVCKDYIFVGSRNKVVYFNKQGNLLKEYSIQQIRTRIRLPVGNNVLVSSWIPGERLIKSGFENHKYRLYIPDQNDFRDLYEFKQWAFVATNGNLTLDAYMFRGEIRVQANNKHLIIGDATRGFYFQLLDEQGDIVKEIDLPYKKRKVTKADRKETIERLETIKRKRNPKRKINTRYIFPDYYPPYILFHVDDLAIYVNTGVEKDGKKEHLIIDFEGNILKKIMMFPPRTPSTFYNGKVYTLIEKDEHSELQVIDVMKLHAEEIE